MKPALILTLACALGACSSERLVAPLHYAAATRAPDESFRATPPVIAPVTEMHDTVRETALPNGLRVVLVERHGFPVVVANLLIDRGALDVDDPGGLNFAETTQLFGRSGDQKVFDELNEQSAKTGATWTMGRSDDSTWAATRSPRAAFDASLEMLARSSIHSHLSPGEYDRRAAELAQAAAWRGSSLVTVERAILFGPDHPYGGRLPKTVPISQDKAQELHDQIFQPTHATLVIVGDVTPAQVDESAARWFGAWSATRTLPRKTAPPPPRNGPRVAVLSRRSLTQKLGAVFARGPVATSDDAAAFDLAAKILGGSSSSTLFEHLREGSGAAYSVGAQIYADRTATWLSVTAAYDGDKAIDGARDVLKAIEALRTGSVTDEDISVARETLVAQWRGAMSTVGDASAYYARSIALGIEPSQLQDYPTRIARLRREDLVRVAKTYLDPGSLHVAFIGEERWLDPGPLGMGGATAIVLE